MLLSIPTLLLVAIFILGLMGLLTLHAWSRGARDQTLGHLGCMLLLAALGVALVSVRGMAPAFVALVLSNIVLLLSAAMNWTAMRVFAGRAPHLPGIFAGALLWLLWSFIPGFYDDLGVRVTVYSLLAAGYGALSALELWRNRQHLEAAYLPALLLTLAHTGFYAVRTVTDHGVSLDQAMTGNGTAFFAFMLFESMLYAIGIAYVTLAMVRERTELKLKAAAYSDPLTGIGNRRAFLSRGEALLAGCARRGQPVALLLCDLDHFKRLNDLHGHQTGDQALIAFSQVARQSIRQEDVLGRIGGEEFACLLASTDAQAAAQVAQRICAGFYGLPLLAPGQLSVSIGIVDSATGGHDLSRLLSMADHALYAAKDQGRNRVQLYAPPSPPGPASPAATAPQAQVD